MSQVPAGWYPDPAPVQPGAAQGHRFWDGGQWTEHVHPGAPYGSPPEYGVQHFLSAVRTTPDGQRLAGWWSRVGATALDFLLVVPVTIAVAWPYWSDVVAAYRDLLRRTMQAAETGAAPPDQAQVLSALSHPMLMIGIISIVMNLVYNVGFLRWTQGTPGKLALGLRVRRREAPGTMPWGTILLRWTTQHWTSFFSLVPVLGSILGLYPFVDCLWPLWDDKKQALHDKAARTNVVVKRTRGGPA